MTYRRGCERLQSLVGEETTGEYGGQGADCLSFARKHFLGGVIGHYGLFECVSAGLGRAHSANDFGQAFAACFLESGYYFLGHEGYLISL